MTSPAVADGRKANWRNVFFQTQSWKIIVTSLAHCGLVKLFCASRSVSLVAAEVYSWKQNRFRRVKLNHLENLMYHFLRQLWLVVGVKLMEFNLTATCFPGFVSTFFSDFPPKVCCRWLPCCFFGPSYFAVRSGYRGSVGRWSQRVRVVVERTRFFTEEGWKKGKFWVKQIFCCLSSILVA